MLNGKPEYITLKLLLSFSFIYDQMIELPDRRYDAFFASVMKDGPLDFLDIRILSWNYDYQFEKAISEYLGETSLSRLQAMMNVIPFDAHIREVKNFGIFKLNGTASFRNKTDFFNPLDDISRNDTYFLIEKLFAYFSEFKKTGTDARSLVGFAWENNSFANLVLNEALRDIENTKAVVVIGYSFPFFNRDTDRKIFAKLNPEVKIYVQDTKPDMVINNLNSVMPQGITFKHKPIPIKIELDMTLTQRSQDVVQFYLPAEL